MYDENKAHYLVATGIVMKDGKYLVTKRSEKEAAFGGQWSVPGGKLTVGDYKNRPMDTSAHWYNIFEDLVRREVKEETGLEIKNVNYLTSLCYIRSDNIPTIIISLYGDCGEGDVVLSDELSEYSG